jgi:hypothetical protein
MMTLIDVVKTVEVMIMVLFTMSMPSVIVLWTVTVEVGVSYVTLKVKILRDRPTLAI